MYFWTMSKFKLNTKEKILEKALELFNERGIEYVGIRELAAELNIRVGNITYYFPKKDDLVYELALNLNILNSKIIVDNQKMNIQIFLEMFQKVFQNHIKYRCLLLSFVHLHSQNERFSKNYENTQQNRYEMLKTNLKTLIKTGNLNNLKSKEINFLVSSIAIIARFWISEAKISFTNLSDEDVINHYVSNIGRMLMPYLTSKGEKQLRSILKKME